MLERRQGRMEQAAQRWLDTLKWVEKKADDWRRQAILADAASPSDYHDLIDNKALEAELDKAREADEAASAMLASVPYKHLRAHETGRNLGCSPRT